MKANEVLKLLRISRQTLTKYVKNGIIKVELLPNGRYEYDENSVYLFLNKDLKRKTYIYARVSTSKQKPDLENQIELLKQFCIPKKKSDNQRYIGIDIGVDNLTTVCNNAGKKAFIINGKPLKSINHHYNKKISHYREIAKRMNNSDHSKRMDILTAKRNSKIDDYLHKASRYIIDYCLEYDICTIVIGKNKEWKQNVSLSKRTNQYFVQIPFARFIEMIEYKAEEYGIAVVTTEESYTSGTSFIDNEEPVKENYNKSRRVHRGMFVSNSGIAINADLNDAYQILKKVVPIKWDSGCVLHPFVVNVA